MSDHSSQSSSDDAAASAAAEQAQQTARKTGRGFLVITAAKVWFLMTGAVTQLGLPIFLGSAELFGVFKIVTEAIGLLNMVMITGTLQAVSKLVSEAPQRAERIVHQAIKLQLMLGLPLALLYAASSPVIAREVFHDSSLTWLMQLSSLIIAFYAFYALFVGYLNGIKSFVRQASLDIGFQTMKTFGMLGLVFLGFGVGGAVAGFVGAAAAIALISGVWVWRLMARGEHSLASSVAGEPAAVEGALSRDERGRLLKFLLWVMAYTFALNGLLRVDLFMLKSIASDAPLQLAMLGDVFGTVSDKMSGFYGAALNLSRLPYQGVIAVTFVIFPLISEATFQQDKERTRVYIEDTFRYCLLLIALVAMPLIFSSGSLIGALYSADYQAASGALAVMSTSIIFFSLFYVGATVITGAGRPGVAAALMGVSLGLSGVFNWVFLQQTHQEVMAGLSWVSPQLGAVSPGDVSGEVWRAVAVGQDRADVAARYVKHAPEYMMAAAQGTALAMGIGCVLAMGWIGRTYRAMPPLKTLARLGLGALVLFGLNQVAPEPATLVAGLGWVGGKAKLATLGGVALKMAIMGILLLVVLGVTREFGAQDRARVMAVIGRRKKKG